MSAGSGGSESRNLRSERRLERVMFGPENINLFNDIQFTALYEKTCFMNISIIELRVGILMNAFFYDVYEIMIFLIGRFSE